MVPIKGFFKILQKENEHVPLKRSSSKCLNDTQPFGCFLKRCWWSNTLHVDTIEMFKVMINCLDIGAETWNELK